MNHRAPAHPQRHRLPGPDRPGRGAVAQGTHRWMPASRRRRAGLATAATKPPEKRGRRAALERDIAVLKESIDRHPTGRRNRRPRVGGKSHPDHQLAGRTQHRPRASHRLGSRPQGPRRTDPVRSTPTSPPPASGSTRLSPSSRHPLPPPGDHRRWLVPVPVCCSYGRVVATDFFAAAGPYANSL